MRLFATFDNYTDYSWYTPITYKNIMNCEYADLYCLGKMVLGIDGWENTIHIHERITSLIHSGSWTVHLDDLPIEPDSDMRYLILEAFRTMVKKNPAPNMQIALGKLDECL
jgi:hypothetical protein